MCNCEDRPACSCDADIYQPYDQEPHEPTHPHYCDCSKCSADDTCELCGEGWTPEDNEDDITQGFHASCAEGDYDYETALDAF